MKTTDKCPEWVKPAEVLDWMLDVTPLREGIMTVSTLKEVAERHCNWLLFFCWTYARTQGFTNKCMKHWDFGNFGGVYETSRAGLQDALSEFIKFDDTAMIDEQVEVEKLYNEVEAYCRGVVYTEPQPLPRPPKPEPPKPQPEEPKPEPEEPKPSEPGKPFDWKKWLKILGPILAGVLTLGSLFLPGWAKTVLDILIKLINGVTG